IPTSVPRAAGNLAYQFIERRAVALTLPAAKDRKRSHVRVRLEDLVGSISTAIVVNNDLVLARIVLKDPPNAPQQDPDGLSLVVTGNTDIDQITIAAKVATTG